MIDIAIDDALLMVVRLADADGVRERIVLGLRKNSGGLRATRNRGGSPKSRRFALAPAASISRSLSCDRAV